MKVICIDNTTGPDSELPVDLIMGKIYTVVDSRNHRNILWYELEGRPHSEYSSDGFAPLSDIDEMEILNKQELQEA